MPFRAIDEKQMAPIHLAAEQGSLTMVKWLIGYGASFEQRTMRHCVYASKTTPMHVAAINGREKVVQYFLALGAALQYPDHGSSSTPLIGAAFKGHTNVVAILLRAGANVDAANNLGATALFCAAQYGKIFMFPFTFL